MEHIDDIIKNDSAFFHKLIKSYVEPLNFGPPDSWYETISFGGFIKVFNTREELDKPISKPREYAFVNKFLNHDYYVISASYHKTLEDLDNHILFDYRVMTNTLFHLKKTILPIEGLSLRFPVKDYIKAALEADNIIQLDNKYFIHPNHLQEVNEK